MAFGFTLLVSGVAIGQMRTITGTVTENNQPVKGVSVFQEGKEEVAVTNAAGVYRVQVSGENPVIIYRHPDYPERKITLGSRITVNMSLGKEKEKCKLVFWHTHKNTCKCNQAWRYYKKKKMKK